MRTDVHTHVFHPAVAVKVCGRLQSLGFSPVGTGLVEDLLTRASAAGIQRVFCHTAALTGSQVRPANNFAIALARRPQLPGEPAIVSFGGIHPDYEHWPDELDRLEQAGIVGIKLHPPFQNLAFDDPRLFPVMEAIGSRFLLMCHVGAEKPLSTNPASPHKLAKLIETFPAARIIAAHLGGYADGSVALEALAGKNIWMDTAHTSPINRHTLRAIITRHPRERLLFGTDYPIFDPATDLPRQQARLGFTDTEMESLLNNADTLVSISGGRDTSRATL